MSDLQGGQHEWKFERPVFPGSAGERGRMLGLLYSALPAAVNVLPCVACREMPSW